MNCEEEAGTCVGCAKETTDTITCKCTRDNIACGSCGESRASLRCGDCREVEHRSAYPCLDFREDPEPGGDVGGWLPAAAPSGAWQPFIRAA